MNDYVTGKTHTLQFDNEFPAWMWNNQVMRSFFAWCRDWNELTPGQLVEIVGMDVYKPSADAMTVQQVLDQGSYNDRQKYLTALVGEGYARYQANGSSWNVRDEHMYNVIEYLFLSNADCQCVVRIICPSQLYCFLLTLFQKVFAHNSHVFDYRATDHAERGELSVGQLCRENFDAYIVAQSTYSGTVRAASEWGGPDREWEIETPASNSISYLLHAASLKTFVLDLDSELQVRRLFNVPHSSRAIGVIYKQGQEGVSHYFEAVHSLACHAIIHTDVTTALRV